MNKFSRIQLHIKILFVISFPIDKATRQISNVRKTLRRRTGVTKNNQTEAPVGPQDNINYTLRIDFDKKKQQHRHVKPKYE